MLDISRGRSFHKTVLGFFCHIGFSLVALNTTATPKQKAFIFVIFELFSSCSICNMKMFFFCARNKTLVGKHSNNIFIYCTKSGQICGQYIESTCSQPVK